jgi:hypothetical protein
MFYVQVFRNNKWQNLYLYPACDWECAVERHYEYSNTYRDLDYRIVSA